MSILLALATQATRSYEREHVVRVLEDALIEMGWMTPENAQAVYDKLFEGWPKNVIDWTHSLSQPEEWFRMGFNSARRISSQHGRDFLAALVLVLERQSPPSSKVSGSNDG